VALPDTDANGRNLVCSAPGPSSGLFVRWIWLPWSENELAHWTKSPSIPPNPPMSVALARQCARIHRPDPPGSCPLFVLRFNSSPGSERAVQLGGSRVTPNAKCSCGANHSTWLICEGSHSQCRPRRCPLVSNSTRFPSSKPEQGHAVYGQNHATPGSSGSMGLCGVTKALVAIDTVLATHSLRTYSAASLALVLYHDCP
jgi:hypothetical protein